MDFSALSDLALAAAAIVVPAVMAWVGHLYTAGLKERDRKATYIAMAVDILKEPPGKDDANLRRWAADIVNHYSEVKMPEKLKDDLVNRQALRQEAIEKFAETMEGMDPEGREGMQATATRMNLVALQKALPDLEISVVKTKSTLAGMGFYNGPLDDALDTSFFSAVAAFQKAEGLEPVDGIFGRDTFKAMMKRIKLG